MRTLSLLFGSALCMGQVCILPAGDHAVPRAEKAKTAAPAKSTKSHESTTAATVAEAIPGNAPLTEQQTQEIEAIRLTDESFAKAYAAGDAAAVAKHFTVDAEYVDELGNVFQGRPAIEESLKAFFEENSTCILEMNIDTVRFISPGIAVEDGSTTMNRGDNGDPIDSRYTTVHVKADGKWLAASVRDHAPKDRRQHKAQLEQLSWLMGDWIDEGDDSIVSFSCKATDSGNFLLREFAIEIGGRKAMSGTQRIGWDPLTGKLRGWIFDSEGAYAEGLWHRDEDSWVLKTIGVTADGQAASSTSIYRQINDHTMTWQSIDYEIGGVQIPDSEVYTIVRQAPVPTADTDAPAVTKDGK